MIFKTTTDGSLTNIFKELKSVRTTFDELDKTTLRSVIKAFNNTSMSVDNLSEKFGELDNSVITYLKSTKKGEATMDGLSKSLDNSATSMVSATTKAKLLSVALNALTGLAISLVIKGITWAVDELIVTLDEQKEKLDDAVNAYEESRTELEKINEELRTTVSRIDELNGKDNLTFTEQDELDSLIKTNDELERKIYLLEQAKKEAEKDVATEAQNTYKKYANNRTLSTVEQIDFYTGSSLLEGVTWENFKDDLPWLIAQYKKQQEILANAQAKGWENIEEQTKDNLELLEGYMLDVSLDYQDLYDKISGLSNFAMTDELEVAKQDLDDILDIVADILGYGGQRSKISFDDIWNSEEFTQYKAELQSLAKEGKLDASVLESNEQYRVLLENTGATAEETAQHIRALVDEIEQSGEGLPNKTPDLFTQLNNSKDSLDKFLSSVKSASEAYTTLLSGNYSSTELLDSIQTINQAVTDMGETLDWEEITSLDDLQDKLEDVSETYAKSVLSDAGVDVDSDFGKLLKDIIQQMYEVEAEFTGMNSQLDRLQSSYKTLTSVLEDYNETGYVNLDNLQALLTADENLISMLKVENGQLVINQEAYQDLVAAQLLDFKAKLDDAAAAEINALALSKAEQATDDNAQAAEDAVEKLNAETEALLRNANAAGQDAIAKAINNAQDAGVSEEEINAVLDKYTAIWNTTVDNYSVDFPSFMNGAKSAGSSAGSATGEAFTAALEKELAALDKSMEAGYINFNDYITARLGLIEEYYRKGRIAADEYYSYLEKQYDQQLSAMDKVVNAVTRRIDTEIDGLEKQKDSIENVYNAQIESLEKQKTLLQEANKERERQADLQKALYELERAQQQKTKMVFTEDGGMRYVTDDAAIKEASQNVDDAKLEIQISELDRSISKLEEARDRETAAIDETISNLKEYKDSWSDLTSAYEEEQDNLLAAQILGQEWAFV